MVSPLLLLLLLLRRRLFRLIFSLFSGCPVPLALVSSFLISLVFVGLLPSLSLFEAETRFGLEVRSSVEEGAMG